MTYSKLTNQVKVSRQSSSRNGAEIDTFLIHHQAGLNDDSVIAAMVSGSRGVSANYTISNEGRITSVVPEELRAWTSGSQYDGGKGAAWDRRSITVEIENQVAGGSWDISPTALNAAAALLQDLRARYSIKNVLGHRDLWNRYQAGYPTFCPGPETVAKIVAIAATQASTAAPTGKPFPETEQESDMPAVIKRSEGSPEWSLVAPGLAGPTPLERGYVTTADPKRALWWERFYEKGSGTADAFRRTSYVAAQAMARLDHAAWLAGQSTSSTPAIDYAALAARVKVPTADEVAKAVVRELKLPGN